MNVGSWPNALPTIRSLEAAFASQPLRYKLLAVPG